MALNASAMGTSQMMQSFSSLLSSTGLGSASSLLQAVETSGGSRGGAAGATAKSNPKPPHSQPQTSTTSEVVVPPAILALKQDDASSAYASSKFLETDASPTSIRQDRASLLLSTDSQVNLDGEPLLSEAVVEPPPQSSQLSRPATAISNPSQLPNPAITTTENATTVLDDSLLNPGVQEPPLIVYLPLFEVADSSNAVNTDTQRSVQDSPESVRGESVGEADPPVVVVLEETKETSTGIASQQQQQHADAPASITSELLGAFTQNQVRKDSHVSSTAPTVIGVDAVVQNPELLPVRKLEEEPQPQPEAYSLPESQQTPLRKDSTPSQPLRKDAIPRRQSSLISDGFIPLEADLTDPSMRYRYLIRQLRTIQRAIDGLQLFLHQHKTAVRETDRYLLGLLTHVSKDVMEAFQELNAVAEELELGAVKEFRTLVEEFRGFCETTSAEMVASDIEINEDMGLGLDNEETQQLQNGIGTFDSIREIHVQRTKNYFRAILATATYTVSYFARQHGLVTWKQSNQQPLPQPEQQQHQKQSWKVECVGLSSLRFWMEQMEAEGRPEEQRLKAAAMIREFLHVDLPVVKNKHANFGSENAGIGGTEDGKRSVAASMDLATPAKKETKKQRKARIKAWKETLLYPEVLGHVHPRFVRLSIYNDRLSAAVSSDQLNTTVDTVLPNTQMDKFDANNLAYRKFFVGQEHRNFFGSVEPLDEIVLSAKREPGSSSNGTEKDTQYRVLLRCKLYPNHVFHFVVPEAEIPVKRGLFGGGSNVSLESSMEDLPSRYWRGLLLCIHPKLDLNKLKKAHITHGPETTDEQRKMEKTIQQMDELRNAFNYKFGLIYAKDGQRMESEWLNNRDASPAFHRFCKVIGDKVALQGHAGFLGGLDAKKGTTGEETLYLKWHYDPRLQVPVHSPPESLAPASLGRDVHMFEVMYHVSTLLPFISGDEQQIQRKRHIGNDLVSLVFLDRAKGDDETVEDYSLRVRTAFDPHSLKSHFLHVYIVVQEIPWTFGSMHHRAFNGFEECAYRVHIVSQLDVPSFSPSLPDPPIFTVASAEDRLRFRDYLTAKLINAENAAYHASKFTALHRRTFSSLLEGLVKDYGELKLARRGTRSSGNLLPQDANLGGSGSMRRPANQGLAGANTSPLPRSHIQSSADVLSDPQQLGSSGGGSFKSSTGFLSSLRSSIRWGSRSSKVNLAQPVTAAEDANPLEGEGEELGRKRSKTMDPPGTPKSARRILLNKASDIRRSSSVGGDGWKTSNMEQNHDS